MARRSRLAGYGRRGPIRLNPHVPKSFRGIKMRSRLLRHEKVERKLRRPKKYGGQGLSYGKAHHIALGKEHARLPKHQVQVYEGKLGSIAHWKPH